MQGVNFPAFSRSLEMEASSSAAVGKNSPGTTSVSPYTFSAGDSSPFAFGAVLRPSRTHGSCESQFSSVHLAIKAAFRERCDLSTMPLAAGLYAVVLWSVVPMRRASEAHSSDRKAGPLSVVMSSGTPKRLIQLERRAAAQALEEESDIGVASGHLVERSIIVNKYLYPLDAGRGPTMST